MEFTPLVFNKIFAYKKLFEWWDNVDQTNGCREAAKLGNLTFLKYGHEHGALFDTETTFWAAYYGHLDCLRYGHENGCPWDIVVTTYAAINGHFDCLKYAIENGCEAMIHTKVIDNGEYEIMKYLHQQGCNLPQNGSQHAVRFKHWKCLKYMVEVEKMITQECIKEIIEQKKFVLLDGIIGSIDFVPPRLEWLNPRVDVEIMSKYIELGCELSPNMTRDAAQNKNIELLKFLCENGCPVNFGAFNCCNDHECFKYLIENHSSRITFDQLKHIT